MLSVWTCSIVSQIDTITSRMLRSVTMPVKPLFLLSQIRENVALYSHTIASMHWLRVNWLLTTIKCALSGSDSMILCFARKSVTVCLRESWLSWIPLIVALWLLTVKLVGSNCFLEGTVSYRNEVEIIKGDLHFLNSFDFSLLLLIKIKSHNYVKRHSWTTNSPRNWEER